ncbi:SsrA-binding protein [Enterobacterales bacterium endosymbiont of Anomoneura mori]|uniref:SsrA-binding protein n=1 Tax=Enterobacterales bacterium endosymbiont of Anomoneura mori TaxID=3132096 RepID=UPI00399CFE2A
MQLLLKKKELLFLFNKIKKDGYTIIPISLYWKKNWSKLEIGLAKGKKKYDKRISIKNREWKKTKNLILKNTCKN